MFLLEPAEFLLFARHPGRLHPIVFNLTEAGYEGHDRRNLSDQTDRGFRRV